MSQRNYCLVSGIVFLLVAAGHALRIIMRWVVLVNGCNLRIRYSAIPVIVGLYLGITALKLLKKPA
jgi:hypothetical protein